MASNKKTLAALERFTARVSSAVPAYQRIQSVIRKRIDSGQLQPGDAVPSERDLARTHHVSLMTARHALAFLEREVSLSAAAASGRSSRRRKSISTGS